MFDKLMIRQSHDPFILFQTVFILHFVTFFGVYLIIYIACILLNYDDILGVPVSIANITTLALLLVRCKYYALNDNITGNTRIKYAVYSIFMAAPLVVIFAILSFISTTLQLQLVAAASYSFFLTIILIYLKAGRPAF